MVTAELLVPEYKIRHGERSGQSVKGLEAFMYSGLDVQVDIGPMPDTSKWHVQQYMYEERLKN